MKYPVCSLYTDKGIIFFFESDIDDNAIPLYYWMGIKEKQVVIQVGNFIIPANEIDIEKITMLKNPQLLIALKPKNSLNAEIKFIIDLNQTFLIELRACQKILEREYLTEKSENSMAL